MRNLIIGLVLGAASTVGAQGIVSSGALEPTLQQDVIRRVLVHAIYHASLQDLRAALIADQTQFLESDAITVCTVGMLGYVDDNGDAQALTAADIRAMR